MNELLLDPIGHNNWATGRLIAFCRELNLTDAQLETTEVGTYGDILATLNHIVRSDTAYVRSLLGIAQKDEADADLKVLAGRAEEATRLWDQLLAKQIDVERIIVVDDGANEVRAGVFLAQALNHANLHREQVCAILTGLGIEPPDVQAWEYAWATGRLWVRPADATET